MTARAGPIPEKGFDDATLKDSSFHTDARSDPIRRTRCVFSTMEAGVWCTLLTFAVLLWITIKPLSL